MSVMNNAYHLTNIHVYEVNRNYVNVFYFRTVALHPINLASVEAEVDCLS